jgi:GNAT superfamily N-acetyltransferase
VTREEITHLTAADAPLAVEVLCNAFHDYPVMRFILGDEGDYDARLETLVGMFVAARVLRGEPVLAILDADGRVVAVAIVTLPGDRPSPPAFVARKEEVFAELGADAGARYEAYGAAATTYTVAEPQHHLNMIGVRGTHQGRGLARRLLEAVHALAAGDAGSRGVSLTTELAKNVPLYEHFGYAVIGHVRINDGLETWSMYRRHV